MKTPRFVELVRVSTKGQADRDTPEVQRKALEALRQHRPGVLVERIEAPGLSGALPVARRPDLQRLERLSKERAFDELRVYALDRLTRSDDLRERAAIWGFVGDSKAVIVDCGGRVLDPADDSGMGEIDYYLQTLFASRERRKIVKRTTDGRRRAAALGRLSGGSPPYARAFDKRTGWTVIEPEKRLLQHMISLYMGGLSLTAVADQINSEGHRTRRGLLWTVGGIDRVLRDDSLTGRWECWGSSISVPPVVDAATVGAVAVRLAERQSYHGARGERYAMLRGLMACGECGAAVHVRPADNGRYVYYQCSARASVHRTKCHSVPKVDAAVRDELRRLVVEHGALEAAAERAIDEPSGPTREESEREIERCRRAESDLLRLVSEGVVEFADAKRRIEEVRARRARAEAQAAAVVERPQWGMMARAVRQVIDRATDAEWAGLTSRLFAPLSLRLYRDRLEGTGAALSLASSASSGVRSRGQFLLRVAL